MANNEYFASKSSLECAGILTSRVDNWANNLESNGYLNKLRMAWAAYHGAYYTDVSTGHQITFSGSQGEMTSLPINHVRNLAQHILVMTCSSRPSMEARATNTDYKSLTQTVLANGLLDYYMREKRLEKYLKNAVEYAVVMGAGFIKLSWNETSGQLYDFNEELNSPIYEGDVEFTNLSPFDIVMDSTKEHQDHDWIICRSWKNKYDVVAKYPEFKDKIIGLPTKQDALKYRFLMNGNHETDDIAIYEFFHKRSEVLPDGRYLMFLSSDVVLSDGPLPYRQLPIFRISPGDILGSPYGYTNVFDLLPIQEGLNAMYSTIMSNQNAFGVQSIIVPRGADIAISELSNGLNIIEANTQNGLPQALQLTKTSPETFKFADMLEHQMEVISGVNSVARGQPEPSLKSGAALALIQSMAVQFMSGLQQSYVELIEDVGTALINMLRDFAAVPRVAAIVGKSHRAEMKEFKGDDLANINRVIVDVANPLSKTTAGKVQMAEQLLQMGAIKTPADYFMVLNTGNLQTMTENTQSQLQLIKGENEKLLQGIAVPTILYDDHKQHIQEHLGILADPDLRNNEQLAKIVLDHVQNHINQSRQVDPNIVQWLGMSPAPPSPQPQGPPQGNSPQEGPSEPQEKPPQGGPMAQPPPPGPGPELPSPQSQQLQPPPGVNMPNMPQPSPIPGQH